MFYYFRNKRKQQLIRTKRLGEEGRPNPRPRARRLTENPVGSVVATLLACSVLPLKQYLTALTVRTSLYIIRNFTQNRAQ